MRGILLIQALDGATREHTLGALTTIGRQPDQHVQLLDRRVSKAHALITFSEGAYYLQDKGSRNGTYINGALVARRTRLHTGDEISIGSSTLLFQDPDIQCGLRRSGWQVVLSETGVQSAIRSRISYEESEVQFSAEADLGEHDLRVDYEKLRVAFELNSAIGTQYDVQEVLNTVLRKAFELTGADRGVILLVREGGELEPVCCMGRQSEDEALQLSRTILSEVLYSRSAVLSSDALLDSRFGAARSVIMQKIRSTMCVPLLLGSEVLGVIHLDSQLAAGIFKKRDLQILTAFAQQAALRIANVRLAKRAEEEALVRANLSRLLSPNLVDEVVRGQLAVEPGGVLRQATVLFADIRGFTAISERLPPQDLVSMLNGYFEIMVEIIFKHEGTLDKFIGDELMAVWGAPVPQLDDAARAVSAAQEMMRELERFNQFRVANGEWPIICGIGINCGAVVAGYMGSTRTLSYTVIGDVVNTAARLCDQAQPNEVLVSEALARRLGAAYPFEPMAPVQLKGKSQPVEVRKLLWQQADERGPEASQEHHDL